ncbi:MAG: hypothetical protein HGB36_12505 [Chlorobiaceae bacterium]|nr:hypothetical protein [Chlorobiaceae bacterium]
MDNSKNNLPNYGLRKSLTAIRRKYGARLQRFNESMGYSNNLHGFAL